MSFLSSLFGDDSRSSSTASTTSSTTNQADNRVVLGQAAAQIGAFGTYATNSNNRSATSFEVNDSRDYSNRSVSNWTGTDGGSVQIAGFNSQLLRSVSENQGDTVRLLAAMGADGISKQAAAATNLFATGSAEAGKAWGHTVDKSSELIDRLLTSASATVTGAQTVARDAISSFQPTENKQAGTMNYALLAAVAIVAIFILKKA